MTDEEQDALDGFLRESQFNSCYVLLQQAVAALVAERDYLEAQLELARSPLNKPVYDGHQ